MARTQLLKPRPTQGSPEDALLEDMCARARQVAGWCDKLGFSFAGADRLISHLRARTAGGEAETFVDHPDPLAMLQAVDLEAIEDPDLRPYIWDLED